MKQTSDVLHCLYTARFFFFTYFGNNNNKDQLHMRFPLCPLNQHMSLPDLPSPSHMALIRAEAAQRLHSATSARPVLPHTSAAHLWAGVHERGAVWSLPPAPLQTEQSPPSHQTSPLFTVHFSPTPLSTQHETQLWFKSFIGLMLLLFLVFLVFFN